MASLEKAPSQDSEDEFFKKDTPHGLVKRFMWKQYIQAFIAKTQHRGYTTVVFDGFAGVGRYGEAEEVWPDEIERYGSPLISIRVAINFMIRKYKLDYCFKPSLPSIKKEESVEDFHKKESVKDFHTRSIKLYFVEKLEDNFKKLRRNVLAMFQKYDVPFDLCMNGNDKMTLVSRDDKLSIGCEVSRAEFKDVAPPEVTGNDRLVSMIDPYGYIAIPMERVKLFAGPNKEVYITFMSQFVNRFKTEKREALETVYGIPHERILRLFKENDGKTEGAALSYLHVLKEKANVPFGLSFEMRNKGNVPLYHLIFCSNHEKGFEAMKEAMKNGSQSPYKFQLSDYDFKEGQILNLKNGQKPEDVANKIYKEFRGQLNIPMNDIERFILDHTIFVWRKTPLKIMEKDGRIQNVISNPDRQEFTFPDHCNISLDFLK